MRVEASVKGGLNAGSPFIVGKSGGTAHTRWGALITPGENLGINDLSEVRLLHGSRRLKAWL
jgi:hypothetical protein